jgi:phospho-N-acetylmuramoyl-pentapeptide-transferase
MTLLHESTIIPVSHIMLQAVLGFLVAMLLTPIYTHYAYKYKWWKQVRDTATTGEKAPVFHKLHAAKHKRHIPTMGGLVIIGAITVVTLLLNLSRAQTYLPLFALVAAQI